MDYIVRVKNFIINLQATVVGENRGYFGALLGLVPERDRWLMDRPLVERLALEAFFEGATEVSLFGFNKYICASHQPVFRALRVETGNLPSWGLLQEAYHQTKRGKVIEKVRCEIEALVAEKRYADALALADVFEGKGWLSERMEKQFCSKAD